MAFELNQKTISNTSCQGIIVGEGKKLRYEPISFAKRDYRIRFGKRGGAPVRRGPPCDGRGDGVKLLKKKSTGPKSGTSTNVVVEFGLFMCVWVSVCMYVQWVEETSFSEASVCTKQLHGLWLIDRFIYLFFRVPQSPFLGNPRGAIVNNLQLKF